MTSTLRFAALKALEIKCDVLWVARPRLCFAQAHFARRLRAGGVRSSFFLRHLRWRETDTT
jgi:hypothetical protein